MPKITKRTVDAAMPDPGRRFYIWDSEVRGFALLVLPSGLKSYIFQYRTPEGRSRRATIGKHGALTPDEARLKAAEMRRAVAAGGDPLDEKQARRASPTVAQILDAYLASGRFAGKAPSTQAIDRGRIERHLKPALGRRYAQSLTPGDVERAFAAIRDGKTAVDVKTRSRGRARVTGGEGTARMAIRLLRSVFSWAVQEGMVPSNPCEHVKTGSDGTRDTILDAAADYARLFGALDRLEREKRIRPTVADAVRLIALTGARRGEIANLRWGQVDLRQGLIILPPAAHKAGRRTGKPRIIGLPAAAQAIIARQPPGGAGDYVFVPARGAGPVALSKAWRVIRVAAELPADIGLHGLRHSYASHLAMAGAEAAEIMTALGHRQLSTSQKYIHWAQDARQALAERGAAVALAGMAAATGEQGEVVTIRKEAADA